MCDGPALRARKYEHIKHKRNYYEDHNQKPKEHYKQAQRIPLIGFYSLRAKYFMREYLNEDYTI